jgi:hypothetical protein
LVGRLQSDLLDLVCFLNFVASVINIVTAQSAVVDFGEGVDSSVRSNCFQLCFIEEPIVPRPGIPSSSTMAPKTKVGFGPKAARNVPEWKR